MLLAFATLQYRMLLMLHHSYCQLPERSNCMLSKAVSCRRRQVVQQLLSLPEFAALISSQVCSSQHKPAWPSMLPVSLSRPVSPANQVTFELSLLLTSPRCRSAARDSMLLLYSQTWLGSCCICHAMPHSQVCLQMCYLGCATDALSA